MRRLSILFLVVALIGAACGGGDGLTVGEGEGGDETPTTAPEAEADPTATPVPDEPEEEPTAAPEPTPEPEPYDISLVENSVVQIQGQGTFVQSDGFSAYNTGFTGTGFVISEDGLVVTNNHVVQGAATLAVSFSDGDPLNAQLLGVSECSDLAVIQLVGDGYTPLEFREDPVNAGLTIFSAGFPASDEVDFDDLDFTLTSGIVGSTDADGETNWASVDGVIQHDAQILGGNSGGPLVDENGQVVGVNYAGALQFNTNFAIAAQEARPIIDQLAAGENVNSLGINGEAVLNENFSGIFVSSVQSGSPADRAGIEAGDLMLTLENLVLATNGTMEDYCDILRTKGDEATMDVQVYRPSLDLVLSGQINGDPIELPLITSTVIEESGGDDGSGGDAGNSSASNPYTYVTVMDDEGLISVDVPTEWSDVNGVRNDNFGPSVWASPDLQAFQDSWSVPGIIVESSPDFTSADIPALLEARDLSDQCTDFGADDYDDGFYAGTLQIWGECGGTDTFYVILAASPVDPDLDYLVRVEVQAPEQRDIEAADQALNTFIANI